MPIFHLVAPARGWLYTRSAEALHLWRSLESAFPEALGCTLMPDHVHMVLPHADADGRFGRVRSGYTRWLASQPRWIQPFAWGDVPPPEELAPDPGHLRRTIRYILLNPCRARLVGDPLAWAWSTHRDATGFSARPWLRHPDPDRFHGYVSGDPSVSVTGTMLPRVQAGEHDLRAVSAAVSAVFRIAGPELTYGPARAMAIRTAAAFGHTDSSLLADWSGCTVRQVQRLIRGAGNRWKLFDDDVLSACVRSVGDDRMAELEPGDLTRSRLWQAYRREREARRGSGSGSSPFQRS